MKKKIVQTAFDWYAGACLSVFSRYPLGTNVFEREWDVLILLDTCRVDALEEVAPEYDFLADIGAITSVGSTSSEWIACTFVDEYEDILSETIYVSANGYTDKILKDRQMPDEKRGPSYTDWATVSHDDLLELDQVWEYAPDPDHGHTRPAHVTDRAIANARDHTPERLVVHYSQPHEPYTATADAEGRDELREHEKHPWEYLNSGGDFEKVWDAYLANLRMVLDSVSVLLENIDAETVAISADHGEGFGGKWGVNRHPICLPHPKIKRVPWATTTATDTGSYEPSLEPQTAQRDVDEQLAKLGYM